MYHDCRRTIDYVARVIGIALIAGGLSPIPCAASEQIEPTWTSCAPPGLHSEVFAASIAGQSVPVISFGDIDYVHFSCHEPVKLVVRRSDGKAARRCRVRPEHVSISTTITEATVRFPVSPGQKLVVNVDHLRKLFVFAEREDADTGNADRPERVDIVRQGADPTGRQDCTDVVQAAIDSLPHDGVLFIPPGCYRTGSLRLKSNMTLHLARGALLKGSDDHRRFRRYHDGSYLYYLLADGVENVCVTGHGTMDANGYHVRRACQAERGLRKQPGRLLLCTNSRNVQIHDVVLRDSFSWTLHLADCEDCVLQNVKLLADTRHSNVDGLDVDGCRRLKAEDLFIYSEDDAISVKAAWSRETPEDLSFLNCVLWAQNATGVRIGTETRSEAFRRIRFEGLSILRANAMIRVFCYDGAAIEDLVFRNIHTEEVSMYAPAGYDEFHRISEVSKGETYLLQLQVRKRGDTSLGSIRNIVFEDVHAAVPAGSKIKGYDAPEGIILIRDVTFRNLHIGDQWIRDPATGHFNINDHVRGVRFETRPIKDEGPGA